MTFIQIFQGSNRLWENYNKVLQISALIWFKLNRFVTRQIANIGHHKIEPSKHNGQWGEINDVTRSLVGLNQRCSDQNSTTLPLDNYARLKKNYSGIWFMYVSKCGSSCLQLYRAFHLSRIYCKHLICLNWMSTVYKLFNGGMVTNFVSCCIAVDVSDDLGMICYACGKSVIKSGNLIVNFLW